MEFSYYVCIDIAVVSAYGIFYPRARTASGSTFFFVLVFVLVQLVN
jgi:hypothetical protein